MSEVLMPTHRGMLLGSALHLQDRDEPILKRAGDWAFAAAHALDVLGCKIVDSTHQCPKDEGLMECPEGCDRMEKRMMQCWGEFALQGAVAVLQKREQIDLLPKSKEVPA
jgi:hypothetical protein